jgi:hypothetical protein
LSGLTFPEAIAKILGKEEERSSEATRSTETRCLAVKESGWQSHKMVMRDLDALQVLKFHALVGRGCEYLFYTPEERVVQRSSVDADRRHGRAARANPRSFNLYNPKPFSETVMWSQ